MAVAPALPPASAPLALVAALPQQFLREVVAAYPRLDLAAEFTACVTDQAERKPTTAAHRIVEGGVAAKLRRNPLESLG